MLTGTQGVEHLGCKSIASTYMYNVRLFMSLRMGEWAEICNRVPNRIRLHHQIDQAFPFFSVQY